jgi:hypothetical protein
MEEITNAYRMLFAETPRKRLFRRPRNRWWDSKLNVRKTDWVIGRLMNRLRVMLVFGDVEPSSFTTEK